MALRNFACLHLKYRQEIRSVNLRIIAKFYDDKVAHNSQQRVRRISSRYHEQVKKGTQLRVHLLSPQTPTACRATASASTPGPN